MSDALRDRIAADIAAVCARTRGSPQDGGGRPQRACRNTAELTGGDCQAARVAERDQSTDRHQGCQIASDEVVPCRHLPSALKLLDLIQSHRVTAVIYVAAKLGIADLLAERSKVTWMNSSRQPAPISAALARLLAALVTIGICARAEAGSLHDWAKAGAALVGDASPSFKAWAILEGELLSRTWSGMLETIMTGKTAAQLQGFDNSFDLMARMPETVRIFNAAMAELTALVTADVLAAYDFSRISHLLDVGGGSGELIGAVAQTLWPYQRDGFRPSPLRGSRDRASGEARRQRSRELPRGGFFRIRPGGRRQHHSQEHHSRLERCAQLHDPAKLPARDSASGHTAAGRAADAGRARARR